MESVEFCFIQTDEKRTIQLRVKYLNIDNPSSYECLYPVIFTPTSNEIYRKIGKKYCLNSIVEQNLSHHNVFIININF